MKTINTCDLTRAALNWAVAQADETVELQSLKYYGGSLMHDVTGQAMWKRWHPSTSWKQGGPIIEREEISVSFGDMVGASLWNAEIWPDYSVPCTSRANGPTPLIAAMRCYVASKLGDTVEIPEELI